MIERIEALNTAIASLAGQVSELARVVDVLARAEVARASASTLNSQVVRELSKDLLHIKDRIEFIAENTKPRRRLRSVR